MTSHYQLTYRLKGEKESLIQSLRFYLCIWFAMTIKCLMAENK